MKEFHDLKLHGTRSRQRYLNKTDWLALRSLELGVPEDQTMRDKRQLARDELSLIRDAVEYSEIEHLTKEF